MVKGELDDYHFWSAVCIISKTSGVLDSFFVSKFYSSKGIYCIQFTGEEPVVIDDFSPFKDGKPLFSYALNAGPWISLLEKAWAKLKGSCRSIQEGTVLEILKGFTGASGSKFEATDINAWTRIIKAFQDRRILFASTSSEHSEMISTRSTAGMIPGYSYNIVSFQDVQGTKLIYIQVPQEFPEEIR